MEAKTYVVRRRRLQWVLAPIVVLTIALGWKYPVLGFSVPVVMALGMVMGAVRGRYVCGNLCPRGSFYDRYFGWALPARVIPVWLQSMALRWILFAVMMAFMVFNLSRDFSSWTHWGRVFWLICTVTTAAGLLLAAFVHPRGWCTVCPMGTMQNALGGNRRPKLLIDKELCRVCYKCEKVCPLRLPVVSYRESGVMSHRDCIQCGECIAVCPFGALAWENASKLDTPVQTPSA